METVKKLMSTLVEKLVVTLGSNTADLQDENSESTGKWAKRVFKISKVLNKMEDR